MYHYLYKIVNNISGEYYYGVHSTEDLDDGYFGSGAQLKNNIKEFGKNNFTKTILEFFPNRSTLMKEEKRIVNNEMLKDPKCLNVILGGGELKGSVGKKCVIKSGEYIMVDKHNNEYQNFFVGRICINDGKNLKYIKPYEIEYYRNLGWEKGTIYESPGKNKNWMYKDDKIEQVSLEDQEQYLKNGWNYGMIGEKELIWIYKDDNIKRINKEDLQSYIDDGWNLGFHRKTVNGKVCVRKNKKLKYINKEDLQSYIDDGWVKREWNNIIWINKDKKNIRINKEDIQSYIDNGWTLGRYYENNPKAKPVYFFNLNNILVMKFNKVTDAVKQGYNNIHKYVDTDKVYLGQYLLKSNPNP